MALSNRPKWILATAAALAGTGIGGVALAGTGSTPTPLPGSVNLQDARPVATATVEASTVEELFQIRANPFVRADDGSFTLTDNVDTSDDLSSVTSDSVMTTASLSADTVSAESADSAPSSDSPESVSDDSVSLDTSGSPDSF